MMTVVLACLSAAPFGLATTPTTLGLLGGPVALPDPTAALAYIDPGTGALILQMLVGAVVGVFVFARNQVRRFVGWVGALLGRGHGSSAPSPSGSEEPGAAGSGGSESAGVSSSRDP